MTRNEVILEAIAGKLKWHQAAQIGGVSDRQMRRLKKRWEEHGYDGLVDQLWTSSDMFHLSPWI